MTGQAVARPVVHPVYRSLRSLVGAPLAVGQSLSPGAWEGPVP